MAIHLEKIVKEFIAPKKIELSSFGWKEVTRIGRGATGKTAADIVSELKNNIEKIRLDLSDKDHKELEKKIDKAL